MKIGSRLTSRPFVGDVKYIVDITRQIQVGVQRVMCSWHGAAHLADTAAGKHCNVTGPRAEHVSARFSALG